MGLPYLFQMTVTGGYMSAPSGVSFLPTDKLLSVVVTTGNVSGGVGVPTGTNYEGDSAAFGFTTVTGDASGSSPIAGTYLTAENSLSGCVVLVLATH